jgi:hypothetical protein
MVAAVVVVAAVVMVVVVAAVVMVAVVGTMTAVVVMMGCGGVETTLKWLRRQGVHTSTSHPLCIAQGVTR